MQRRNNAKENILHRIRHYLQDQNAMRDDVEIQGNTDRGQSGDLVDVLAASCRRHQTDFRPVSNEHDLIELLRFRIETAVKAGDKIGYCCAEDGVSILPDNTKRSSIPAAIHRFLLREPRIHKIYPGTCPSPQDRKLLLATFQVLITGCEVIAAFPGVIVSSSDSPEGRLASLLPVHHWVIVSADRIVPSLSDVYEQFSRSHDRRRHACVTFIAGPSRTADIEKKLILGVHGPLTVSIFLFRQSSLE